MSEAAAKPAPEPSGMLEEREALYGHLDVLLERNFALLRSLERKRGTMPPALEIALTENADRLADLQGELREQRASDRKALALRSLEQMRDLMAAQDVPAESASPRRKGGHRRRDPADRARMRLAAFTPAPAVAWAAQHAAWLGAAGAATTAATVTIGTALTLTAPPGHAASHAASNFSGPVASAAPWTAVPVPSPSRSRKASQDAKTAAPAAPYPYASVPAVTPSPSPAPPSPSQAPGVLVAASSTLDLGVLGAGSVTLTAEGGPVSWAAAPADGLDVWPSSGTLAAGESVSVSFRATDQTHSGFDIVDLGGGVDVTVSWPAVAGLVQNLLPPL